MDISQIYFLQKWTNPKRHFLKINCRIDISQIYLLLKILKKKIYLTEPNLINGEKNHENPKKIMKKQKKIVKNEKNCEKMKKIVKTQFGKCPFGNWFSGNVFWDSPILIKSILRECPFTEILSRF